MANIIPTVKSDDISVVLDNIAHNFHPLILTKDSGIVSQNRLELAGEVRDLEGVLSNDAAYSVRLLEEAQSLPAYGDWGYYAKEVANASSQWLKAWGRWNQAEAIYDYYLEAKAGVVFSHATPYVGGVRREV